MASQKDVLMVPVVFLKSFHSFLLSSTFCISSSFFCHILQQLEPEALSPEPSWQISGARSFGVIIRVHPGTLDRVILRVILQREQHYSEVHYPWMDVSHMREVSITVKLLMQISHW